MPTTFWSHAFQTAVYLINRLPTPLLDNISPLQKLFGSNPDYLSLRTFGCTCYPWLRPYSKHKLDQRSIRCVFLGYSLQHKGYKCLDLKNNRIYISPHVTFEESTFPFASSVIERPKVNQSPTSSTLGPLRIIQQPTCPPKPNLTPPTPHISHTHASHQPLQLANKEPNATPSPPTSMPSPLASLFPIA